MRAIAQDREGRLWVGTDRGFFRLDGDKLLRLDARDDTPIMPVKAIYVDRSGTVWVSSNRLFRMQGDRAVRVTGDYGSASDINSIFEAADGSLWLAAESGAHHLVNGVAYGPVIADLERSKGIHSWATVAIKEGKNREVKRLMESLGLKVSRLIRVQFGPFHLGQLQEGAVEEIPAEIWRKNLAMGKKRHPKGPARR